jgi:hypothetical protein
MAPGSFRRCALGHRKLLHAIWGMLKHEEDFDGNKFFGIAAKTA